MNHYRPNWPVILFWIAAFICGIMVAVIIGEVIKEFVG